MHIYTTHSLKLGTWIREEKKREWFIPSVCPIHLFMHIYHMLTSLLQHKRWALDQRREKEGVVITSHLYI